MAINPKKNLEEIKFGEMNELKDSPGQRALDLRRTAATTALQQSIGAQYVPQHLSGKTIWNGIILRTDGHTIPLVTNNFEKTLDAYEMVNVSKPGKVQSYSYKVYVAELDSFRAPLPSLREDDKIAQSMINTHLDAFPPAGKNYGLLSPGTPVVIAYGDKEYGTKPTIIQVDMTRVLPLEGVDPLKYQFGRRQQQPAPSTSGGKPCAPPSCMTNDLGLQYNKFRTGTPEYKAIQIHYTVTHSTKNAIGVLKARGLSYNYIIGKDGTVTMAVDPATGVARHAGRGTPDQTRIGISFVNLGYDDKHAGKHGSLPKAQWEDFSGRLWEPYPSAQIAAGKQLVSELVKRWPDIKTIFGHEDTSGGKRDPGPAFDRYWKSYEALLPSGRAGTPRSTKGRV